MFLRNEIDHLDDAGKSLQPHQVIILVYEDGARLVLPFHLDGKILIPRVVNHLVDDTKGTSTDFPYNFIALLRLSLIRILVIFIERG